MSNLVRAKEYDWENIRNAWSPENYTYYTLRDYCRNSFNTAKEAQALIDECGDVGSLTLGITESDLEECEDLAMALYRYSYNIYSEIYEKIDHLFAQQIQGLMGLVYKLNPNEYTLDDNGTSLTLENFIDKSPVDEVLKEYYQGMMDDLSNDSMSAELYELIDPSLWWWHDDMEFYDIKEIDRTIYTFSHPMADIFYEMSPLLVIRNNDFDKGVFISGAHYNMSSNGINFNLEKDRENVRNPYTTFLHEMGHMLDYNLRGELKGYGSYINGISFGSDSKYAEQFFNDLQNDINSYIADYLSNYNTIHGATLSDAEIRKELKKELRAGADPIYAGKRNEISDIFGG